MDLKLSVYPKRKTNEACEAGMCVVSVSLGVSEAHLGLLLGAYGWASRHYPQVTVYLGDGPLVESTLKTLGLEPERATLRGRELAGQCLSALGAVAPVKSLSAASEIAGKDAFIAKRKKVQFAFEQDEKLHAAVGREAERYVSRLQRHGRLGVSLPAAMEMARGYILFEIAMYAYLSEQGYWVDLYAGEELGVLKLFMQGRLAGFPELARRACISAKRGH